ncbi:hypothetical protein L1987_64680 [Smallanthus sonchifolius]|uniref:Uncharacterized protein n=1 Tax=Smallanthus sonchifolius TaxID=185202 RepID=A0ACB9BSD9_9ASTR|nr:hypothetical protein L1987_64680 [Smallanthus sonchifolius]
MPKKSKDFVDVKYLDLQFVFSASGSQINSGLSNLTPLSLKRNNNITAQGISALSGLVNLLNLDFERCPWIHGDLVHLKGLSKFQSLNLNCCNCIDDADMEPLPEAVADAIQRLWPLFKAIFDIEVIKIFGSDPSCADYLKVLIESLFSNTAHNHHFEDLFHTAS